MQDVARLPRRQQPARATRLRPDASRRAGGLVLGLAVVVAVAAAGCRGGAGNGGDAATPPPSGGAGRALLDTDAGPVSVPPTLPLPAGYQLSDTSGVQLRPVMGLPPAGPPPAPATMTGGTARLSGTATGPDGRVGGAAVRIERFVGDKVGRLDVTTAPDGTFAVKGLPGGRYRVRAWSRPFLTVTQPATVFLPAVGGDVPVALNLERHNATSMLGSIGTRGWYIGQQAGVSVLVTQEYVDDNGIARTGGVPGWPITLDPGAGVALVGGGGATTGNDGYARFTVVCTAAGPHAATATSGTTSRTIGMPTCVEPPPPTTAASTSTSAMTNLAVGATVDTPAAGPFPAGSYRATTADAARRCRTIFEVQIDGDWQPGGATAVIEAAGPLRALRPMPGTAPCTYRRTA